MKDKTTRASECWLKIIKWDIKAWNGYGKTWKFLKPLKHF